jgi:hypothetical protein
LTPKREITTAQQDPKAQAALFAKLASAMGKLERLPRSGHNSHFNYDFVTDSDVSDAVRAALASEGVAFFASLLRAHADGKKTVADFLYTFADSKTGATWSCNWTGEAIDSQDKGLAKAATSALKYFLLKTFVLSSGDPLDDSDGDAPIERQGKKAPAKNGNGTEANKTAFFAKVLDDIPYFENVNHVANALKNSGFKAYSKTKEAEMFTALEKHAQEAANKEAA